MNLDAAYNTAIEKGGDLLKRTARSLQFKLKYQVEFIGYMNTWLDAGATPLQACNAIIGAYPNGAIQAKVAAELAKTIDAGGTLADGMRTWFHPSILTIASAGQKVGSEALAEGLRGFVQQEEYKKKLREDFYEPLKGPLSILMFAFLILLAIGQFIVPSLIEEGAEIPLLANIILNVSNFIVNYILIILLGGAAFGLLSVYFLNHSTHRFRLLVIDKKFPGSFVRDFISVRFITVLSLLVRYGQTPMKAAELMTKYATGYEAFHLNYLIRKSSNGEQRIYKLLDSGIFSETSFMRLRIMSEAPGQDGKEEALSLLSKSILSDIRIKLESLRLKCLIAIYATLIILVVSSVIAIMQLLSFVSFI